MGKEIRSAAVLNREGSHRYLLSRIWDPKRPPLGFLMLNPSVADAHTDDPTIGRCLSFARREKAGGLLVVNLFAARSTDPKALAKLPDPVGEFNDSFIRHGVGECETVVVAWGVHGRLNGRGRQVADRLWDQGIALRCLGVTQSGEPKHPLYLDKKTPLVPYAPPHT
ncbi:DUF1643 domain-containing protein [Streptomyces ipomoeae]|nr:DUF1643 domain-containing protein [Streptomyces ipomoeae]